MKWSYRILSVRGIPIRMHLSLLIMLVLLARDAGLLLTVTVMGGMLVAITLHELAHSLVAVRKGCVVREILLLPIGGVARMENRPKNPRDEIHMTIAGPLASLVIAFILIKVGAVLPLSPFFVWSKWGINWNKVELLGVVNLVFFLFNMIPAFPMDGGRILRALLIPLLSPLGATVVASLIGKSLAVIMATLGIIAETNGYGGWTLIVIGAFVFFGASLEYKSMEMEERARIMGNPFMRDRGARPHWNVADIPGEDEIIVEPPVYERDNGTNPELPLLPDEME